MILIIQHGRHNGITTTTTPLTHKMSTAVTRAEEFTDFNGTIQSKMALSMCLGHHNLNTSPRNSVSVCPWSFWKVGENETVVPMLSEAVGLGWIWVTKEVEANPWAE